MKISTYEAESETEELHWWFVGRRKLFGKVLSDLDLPPDTKILDVGSSAGTNLRMLADLGYGNVKGLDLSPEAQKFCAEKGFAEVLLGDVRNIPYADNSVDLVLATDVIEHVKEDDIALSEIFRILKTGGHLLLTVPAFQSLWGIQDDVGQHKRRYKKKPFNALVKTSGFDILESYYFNYLLFTPIWITRIILNLFNPSIPSETVINNKILNSLLLKIFIADIMSAQIIRPPFGVSILTLAKKP